MAKDDKNNLKRKKEVVYLNKDFEGFRRDLLNYAQTFFPNNVKDFSEASVGGMFLEMGAYVGDVMSFYLDHQFSELNIETATELKNIERHLRTAGVHGSGPSPASVEVLISLHVPSVFSEGEWIPDRSALPIVRKFTTALASNGVTFILSEDIDFSKQDRFGELLGEYELAGTTSGGDPSKFKVSRRAILVSGEVKEKKVSIGSNLVKFRKVSLGDTDVTEILSVIDSEGNRYYEVESLTQDTVFKAVLNGNASDNDLVPENMTVIPAPYRYVKTYDLSSKMTSLRFGSGLAESLDDDIIPDPSILSLPLYGKKTFSRFSIDPNSLLKTRTLGVAPVNTTLTITYRHGGGLKHNIGPSSIRSFNKLNIMFPHKPSLDGASMARRTISVTNPDSAGGGQNAPTIAELKGQVTAFRNSQSRMVTKQDLLARIYTMPSNFGRVFRAGISSNPNNPLSSILHVICLDKSRKLTIAPDALKKNLSTYLNEFRLVSDSLDIIDAKVLNVRIKVDVVTDSTQNTKTTLAVLKKKLTKFFNIRNFQIEQPIILSDIIAVILTTKGILSFNNLELLSQAGTEGMFKYSPHTFNVKAATKKGVVFPPKGSIFEMKYPAVDIIIYGS